MITKLLSKNLHQSLPPKYNIRDFRWIAVDVCPSAEYAKYDLWVYKDKPVLSKCLTIDNELIWDTQCSNDNGRYAARLSRGISIERLVKIFEVTEQEQVYYKLQGNALRICMPMTHD